MDLTDSGDRLPDRRNAFQGMARRLSVPQPRGGGSIAFTIVVSNAGPGDGSGTTLRSAVSEGVTLAGTADPGPANNTVTLSAPAGYVDETPANNTATSVTGGQVMLPVVMR